MHYCFVVHEQKRVLSFSVGCNMFEVPVALQYMLQPNCLSHLPNRIHVLPELLYCYVPEWILWQRQRLYVPTLLFGVPDMCVQRIFLPDLRRELPLLPQH